jgi:hypothetical protein
MRCHLPDTFVADSVSQLQQELTAICAAVPHRRDGLRFYVQSVKNRQTPQAVIFKKINTPNPRLLGGLLLLQQRSTIEDRPCGFLNSSAYGEHYEPLALSTSTHHA